MGSARLLATLALLCGSAIWAVQGHLAIGYPCNCQIEDGFGLRWGCTSQSGNEIAYCKTQTFEGEDFTKCKCLDQLSYGDWAKARGWTECNFQECKVERSHRVPHPCSCSQDFTHQGYEYLCHGTSDGLTFDEEPYCKTFYRNKWNEHEHCMCLNPQSPGAFPFAGWKPCSQVDTVGCAPETDIYPCNCVPNSDTSGEFSGGFTYGCKEGTEDEPMCMIEKEHTLDQFDRCYCFSPRALDWAESNNWDMGNCNSFCVPPIGNRREPTPCQCVADSTDPSNPDSKYRCGHDDEVPMCSRDHDVLVEQQQCQCYPKDWVDWIEGHSTFRSDTCNDWCIPLWNKRAHHPCSCQSDAAGAPTYGCRNGEKAICDDSGERCECFGEPFVSWALDHLPDGWSTDTCMPELGCQSQD